MNGSIDWLCWPRFDSPSIFAAILDHERGGHWAISPVSPCQIKRRYLGASNVLQTQFVCDTGQAVLTDLMPVTYDRFEQNRLLPDHELLRELTCTEGEVAFAIDFSPRPNYGADQPHIHDRGAKGLCIGSGRGAYWLRSSVSLEVGVAAVRAQIRLKQSERVQFSLSYGEQSPCVLPALGRRVGFDIECSVKWWQEWTARSTYQGPYREAVTRSALVLKLLAYAPSGAIVAAPTTSLPERIGDSLNWDYRYCWLRDASLTVRALLGLGYVEEAASFLTWMWHSTRLTQPELRILYTLFGRIGPREQELKHLRGYRDSAPVRVGNDARHQRQLDVYGEVIDASAQYAQHGGTLDRVTQGVLIGLGNYVVRNWDTADEGIWEPRSGRQHNTHSRLLCWTALDRLLALDEKGIISGVPRQTFLDEREKIRHQIEQRAWNQKLQSYASTLDGDGLDASLVRIPWYGLEAADSSRMKSTFSRVCENLGSRNGLLFRYRREPPEGAFGICGFWGVEYLALAGSLDQAHATFEELLKYSNDIGLFAEETDPVTGDALGNFPQAFTHVGLISAALTLEEQDRGKAHPAVHTGDDVRS